MMPFTGAHARLRRIFDAGAGVMAFDAFISYSHAADGRMAPALQRAIQRLAKPWYRARALRVFRDESALSANPHLWSSIQSAMDDAEWFVLLASPDAVASEWVNRELAHWLTNKSADRILVVVTDGTWQWDPDSRTLAGTAVPEKLRDAFADEPRHVDLRWAATETDLDMHHARFRDVVAQLAAPMHGIAKDELDGEDVRQHRRAQRLARGGVSVLALLVVVSLVFGTVAVVERNDARRQRTRATASAAAAISRGLAADAGRLIQDHRIDAALLLSTESYRFAVKSGRGTEQTRARAALISTLRAAPSVTGFLRGQDPLAITYSSDGELVASISTAGDIRVWDARTRRPLVHQLQPGARAPVVSINSAHVLATNSSSGVRLWDLRANRPWRWQPPKTDASGSVALSDAGVLAVASGYATPKPSVALRSINTGRRIGRPIALNWVGQMEFSPDGRQIGVIVLVPIGKSAAQIAVQLVDSATGRLGRFLGGQQAVFDDSGLLPTESVGFSPDGTEVSLVTSGSPFHEVATWNVTTGHRTKTSPVDKKLRVLAASHDGHRLVVRDPSVQLSAPARLIAANTGMPIGGSLPLATTTAAFAPTDRMLAIATPGHTIALIDQDSLGTDTLVARSPVATFRDDRAWSWVVLSPSGSFAAGPTVDVVDAPIAGYPSSELIDTATGKRLGSQPPSLAGGYAFSADDSLAISTPSGIVFWGPSSGRELRRITSEGSQCVRGPAHIAFAGSATNGHVALACGSTLWTWKLDATTATLKWHGPFDPSYTALAFSPDISVLTESSQIAVTIRDSDTGRQLARTPTYGTAGDEGAAITSALSPNGRTLAVVNPAGSLDLMDTRTGSMQLAISSPAEAIAFSPDGTMIVTWNLNGVLEVWDPSTGAFIAQLEPRGATRPATGGLLGFTPDGDSLKLLTHNADGTSTLSTWSFRADDWTAAACRIASGNLTRQEWRTFVGSDVPYHRTCPQWPAGT